MCFSRSCFRQKLRPKVPFTASQVCSELQWQKRVEEEVVLPGSEVARKVTMSVSLRLGNTEEREKRGG